MATTPSRPDSTKDPTSRRSVAGEPTVTAGAAPSFVADAEEDPLELTLVALLFVPVAVESDPFLKVCPKVGSGELGSTAHPPEVEAGHSMAVRLDALLR